MFCFYLKVCEQMKLDLWCSFLVSGAWSPCSFIITCFFFQNKLMFNFLSQRRYKVIVFFRRAALLADRFAFLLEGVKRVGINWYMTWKSWFAWLIFLKIWLFPSFTNHAVYQISTFLFTVASPKSLIMNRKNDLRQLKCFIYSIFRLSL